MADQESTGPIMLPAQRQDWILAEVERAGGARIADSTVVEGPTPVANITAGEIDVKLPLTFTIPVPAPSSGTGQYYWVYLRRPANPFDTLPPRQVVYPTVREIRARMGRRLVTIPVPKMVRQPFVYNCGIGTDSIAGLVLLAAMVTLEDDDGKQ